MAIVMKTYFTFIQMVICKDNVDWGVVLWHLPEHIHLWITGPESGIMIYFTINYNFCLPLECGFRKLFNMFCWPSCIRKVVCSYRRIKPTHVIPVLLKMFIKTLSNFPGWHNCQYIIHVREDISHVLLVFLQLAYGHIMLKRQSPCDR